MGDWWAWESRLWAVAHRDPFTLSPRQLVSMVYGLLIQDRDPQGRENIDAALEGRLALSLVTGQPLGLESEDSAVRHETRLAMLRDAEKKAGQHG